MLLGQINQTVGQTIQHTVDYRQWLQKGEIINGANITVDVGAATIGTISYSLDQKAVKFLLIGGNLGDLFNVIIGVTTNLGQTRYDHIGVSVASVP